MLVGPRSTMNGDAKSNTSPASGTSSSMNNSYPAAPVPVKSGGLNGSVQHLLAVYLLESESPKSFVVVDLTAAPPRRALLENTLTSLFF